MKNIIATGILICTFGLAGCFEEKDAADGKGEGDDPSCCQVGTSRSKLFSGSTSDTSGEEPTASDAQEIKTSN